MDQVVGTEAAPKDAPLAEFLVVELENELYAAPLLSVETVMKVPPVTSVPNAPAPIVGIFHRRGKVVVAADLARILGIERERLRAPSYLFVTSKDKDTFGLLVDKVRTVVRVPESEIREPDPVLAARFAPGTLRGIFSYRPPAPPEKREAPIIITAQPAPKSEATQKEMIVAVLDLSMVLERGKIHGTTPAEGMPDASMAPTV